MNGISKGQLAVTAAIAVALHAGIAISLLWVPPPAGAKALGLGGVEISLGPAGGAPGDSAQRVVEAREVPVAEPEDVPADTPPVPVTEPATPDPVAETTAVPVPEPVTIPEPQIVTAIAAPPVPPVEVAEARPVAPQPRPRLKPRPPEKPLRLKPAAAETVPAPKSVETAEPVREQIARETPSTTGSAGKSGVQESPDAGATGAAEATAGGGSPGASADYMSYLLAWLQKHKEYPQSARRRRQQGTALLYFEMDRDGHVHTAALRQSSGFSALDDEARALIRRAEPLPPPPPEVAGKRIRLVVPVQFFLR